MTEDVCFEMNTMSDAHNFTRLRKLEESLFSKTEENKKCAL